MSTRHSQVSVLPKKTGFGKKGYMKKIENKVYIYIDGKTYFVSVKAVRDVLNSTRRGTSIFGF